MTLPSFSKATTQNPRKLFLFSHTKVGKTTLLSGLPNNLIVDTEDGSEFIDAIKFNVIKETIAQNVGKDAKDQIAPTRLLKELSDEIKKTGKQYDYVSLDTATGIESMARQLATILYKNSNIGKSYKGYDVVSDLSNGAGYDWLRKAFQSIYDLFIGTYSKALIITGHVKNASINKDGKELSAQDISLTGKLKQIMCADSDAIGYLFRNKDNINQVVVSFKTNQNDLATGARAPHLRNQEFVLSEYDDANNKFTFNWNKIFKED